MGIFRSKEGSAPSGPYLHDAASTYPAGPGPSGGAMPLPTPGEAPHRRGRLGKIAVAAVWVVVGAAVPVFFGIRSFTVPGTALGPALTGQIDTPITLSYLSDKVSVTVNGGSAQPGDQWTFSHRQDRPWLLIPVAIRRTDSGSGSLYVDASDFSLQPLGGGPTVSGDSGDGYENGEVDGKAVLSDPKLNPGETYTGLIAFQTSARGGEVTLNNPDVGHAVGKWEVNSTVATPVMAALGRPARGDVGAPSFVVNASNPKWLKAGDPALYREPDSGVYLVVDFQFAADESGNDAILPRNLVFVPQASKTAIVGGGPGVLEGPLYFTTLSDGNKLAGRVAFDVEKGPGTLELVDGAGRVVVSWALNG